jgi:beta-lactamase superfamily II metal-dependent hydrolase
LASIHILDVGHGNCTVLVDKQSAVIIDAGGGSTLLEFLEAHHITEIRYVLVSHADSDHINGLTGLFAGSAVPVGDLYVNPDRARNTKRWRTLVYEMEKKNTSYRIGLASKQPAGLRFAGFDIEVLSPPQDWVVLGVNRNGSRLRPNTLSAAIRIVRDGHPIILLAADIDQLVVDEWLRTGRQARADILVFPHHGGRPGRGTPVVFARQLCELVKPKTIVFSIGRTQFRNPRPDQFPNPRPDIVSAIRSTLPRSRIVCTQLSANCAATVPTKLPGHLSEEPALGKPDKACCAGTISIDLSQAVPFIKPEHSAHLGWLRGNVPKALCMKAGE